MGRKNQLALQLTKMIEDMKNTCKRIFQKPKRNGKMPISYLHKTIQLCCKKEG